MPHNRTRMWVGLAIVAVTIPAVAQYIYRPRTNDARAQGYLQQARWNATNSVNATRNANLRLASSPAQRDYLAEVDAAIGRQGTVFANGQAYDYDNGPDYAYDSGPANGYPAADYRDLEDEMFDFDPLGGPVFTDDRLPDPALLVAPDAVATGNPDDEEVAEDEAAAMDDEATYAGGLTDGAVYATVVNNLASDEREEFVRAWAAMTPDQRAELLDGFRERLEGDGR